MLFTEEDKPTLCRMYTLDDFIWDHQLPLFAEEKGFLQRLGFALETMGNVEGKSMNSNEYLLAQRFENLAQESSSYDLTLAALPRALTPEKGWQSHAFAVWNLYDGYAVIGRNRKMKCLSDMPADSRWPAFRTLVSKIRSGRACAYEEKSAEFLRFIYALADEGEKPAPVFPDVSDFSVYVPDLKQRPRDVMYDMLVDGEADFVVGPATTRALAIRARFPVLLDVPTLWDLISRQFDADVSREWKSRLATLFTHNSWQVYLSDTKPESRDARLLRLASVVHFTVAYLRNSPEAFVRFAHLHVQDTRRLGALPLDHASIRAAIAACYRFETFEEQGPEFFDASSLISYRENGGKTNTLAAQVHFNLLDLRHRCHQLVREIDVAQHARPVEEPALAEQLENLKSRAWMHYRIFNFYDAERLFREARMLLNPVR